MSKGAPKAPITYEGAHDPTRTYLPRQVATKSGTAYLSLATSTGVDPGTDPTVWLPLGGGGAAAPSSTPLVVVYANAAPTIPAGTAQFYPDWSSATMDKGDAWSGVTGSALNLDVDQDSGDLWYPAGEGIYDLQFAARLSTSDLTDVGRSVGLGFNTHGRTNGVGADTYGCYKPLRHVVSFSGDYLIADVAFAWTDFVWVNNTTTLHTRIEPFVDASLLTADIGLDNIQLMVTKRV